MKKLIIRNFRCYSEAIIDFRRGVNLFIGDNGSGKTTILKACRYVMSSFFSGFSDENTEMNSPGNNDFSVNICEGEVLPFEPIEISFYCYSDMYPILGMGSESFNLGDCQEPFVIKKKSTKNSRVLLSGLSCYRGYTSQLKERYVEGKGDTAARRYELPLFASFSTEDIHAHRKIDTARFKKYLQKPSFGYYECLNGNGFLTYWLKRLLVLQEGQKNLYEIDIVGQAIKDALGGEGCGIVESMVVRHNQGKVYYILTDGREVEAELLSDGYKRLVNIVTDLAFRCALLNHSLYGLEAAKRTNGIVLIDEIDLHLHPALQTRVLKGLHHAFPQLQIIATTHAPMVMTGVENNDENVVYKLSYSQNSGYAINESTTYGLDCSTIVESIMGVTPRDERVDNLLNDLFNLIDNDEDDLAHEKLAEMKNRFGNGLPELSRAEAMLNFSIAED